MTIKVFSLVLVVLVCPFTACYLDLFIHPLPKSSILLSFNFFGVCFSIFHCDFSCPSNSSSFVSALSMCAEGEAEAVPRNQNHNM